MSKSKSFRYICSKNPALSIFRSQLFTGAKEAVRHRGRWISGFQNESFPVWWLNQPLWKICSANWESSPSFGGENKKKLCFSAFCWVNCLMLTLPKKKSLKATPEHWMGKGNTGGGGFCLLGAAFRPIFQGGNCYVVLGSVIYIYIYVYIYICGGFLKCWYPHSHPKMIILSMKSHGFVGETQHFRKPPFKCILINKRYNIVAESKGWWWVTNPTISGFFEPIAWGHLLNPWMCQNNKHFCTWKRVYFQRTHSFTRKTSGTLHVGGGKFKGIQNKNIKHDWEVQTESQTTASSLTLFPKLVTTYW